MPQSVSAILELVVQFGEIIGASALILGFVIVTIRFFLQIRTRGALAGYGEYRKALGRVVLIGLEILVAVTIIKTVTIDPSPESLGLLVITIVLRTILSWTTVLEMNGRWPWQKASARES